MSSVVFRDAVRFFAFCALISIVWALCMIGSLLWFFIPLFSGTFNIAALVLSVILLSPLALLAKESLQ